MSESNAAENLPPVQFDPAAAKEKDDRRVDALLKELGDSKDALLGHIKEVEGLNKQVKAIFPTTAEYRDRHLIEDKLKIHSSFFSTILSLRKEYHSLIKEEIKVITSRNDSDGGSSENFSIHG